MLSLKARVVQPMGESQYPSVVRPSLSLPSREGTWVRSGSNTPALLFSPESFRGRTRGVLQR